MLQLSTLLVPTDFSGPAHAAARRAAQLARIFSARLVYAHVIEPQPAAYRAASSAAGASPQQAAEGLRDRLLEWAAETSGKIPFEAVLLDGDPAERIERLAQDTKADMVVAATRGYGRFRRMLMGSLTAKLLHDLPMPVFTGAHLEEGPTDVYVPGGKILCALGLRELEHSREVLRWARDFARKLEAELFVAHTPTAIDWGAGEWFPPDTRRLLEQASSERLARLAEEEECRVELLVGGNDAMRHVGDSIARIGASTLILGRSADHSWTGGSDAYSIIRTSTVPVISV